MKKIVILSGFLLMGGAAFCAQLSERDKMAYDIQQWIATIFADQMLEHNTAKEKRSNLLTRPISPEFYKKWQDEISKSDRIFSPRSQYKIAYNNQQQELEKILSYVSETIQGGLKTIYKDFVALALPDAVRSEGTKNYAQIDFSKVDLEAIGKKVFNLVTNIAEKLKKETIPSIENLKKENKLSQYEYLLATTWFQYFDSLIGKINNDYKELVRQKSLVRK